MTTVDTTLDTSDEFTQDQAEQEAQNGLAPEAPKRRRGTRAASAPEENAATGHGLPIEARIKRHDDQRKALEAEAKAELKQVEDRRAVLREMLGLDLVLRGQVETTDLDAVFEAPVPPLTPASRGRKPGPKPGAKKSASPKAAAPKAKTSKQGHKAAGAKGPRLPRPGTEGAKVLKALDVDVTRTAAEVRKATGMDAGRVQSLLLDLRKRGFARAEGERGSMRFARVSA
jgi:hypothetical protein